MQNPVARRDSHIKRKGTLVVLPGVRIADVSLIYEGKPILLQKVKRPQTVLMYGLVKLFYNITGFRNARDEANHVLTK